MQTGKLGFDFDGIFANTPPYIPIKIINFLYKGNIVFKKKNGVSLKYRMPGFFEQQIRIFSHNSIFRSPIKNNIQSLRLINKRGNYKLYLVSSRFGFLKSKTNTWLDKNKMKKDFHEIHFNFNNLQPHIFKEKIIKKNDITHYIDDDLDLLVYLANKFPKNNFFWLTENRNHDYKSLPKNIKIIKSLKELYNKHL